MKKIALFTLVTLLLACSNKILEKTIDGTFKGVLPCADCQKIEAELILNKDNSYTYNTTYFKDKKQQSFTDKGMFTLDKTKNLLILDENSGNLRLKIMDNYVEICDATGNLIKSSHNYKLQKIKQ